MPWGSRASTHVGRCNESVSARVPSRSKSRERYGPPVTPGSLPAEKVGERGVHKVPDHDAHPGFEKFFGSMGRGYANGRDAGFHRGADPGHGVSDGDAPSRTARH